MAQIPQYKIVYTESAIQDIEEKADYIAAQFHDPDLAEEWYFRLKFEIQKQLTTFPFKYQPYHVEPWAGGVCGSMSPGMMWCCTVWTRTGGRSLSGPSVPGARIWRRTWQNRTKQIGANRVGLRAGICQNPETGPIAMLFRRAVRVYPSGTLSAPRTPP